jgi:hypothetical protein
MRIVVAWMLAFGLMSPPAALAANPADNEKPGSDSASDVKTDAKASPTPTPTNAEIAAEVDQLRALLKEQSAQIAALRADLASRDPAPASSSTTASGGSPAVAVNWPASPILAPKPGDQDQEKKESPLSFRIGGAEFTPGGFMDFTSIFRTTNTGNLGTNFFAIPFSNQVLGHLTESRFTAQNSRLSLKVHDKFGENDVTGYLEMDFLGNDAANVFVTSNSHTFRQRLYFVDYKRGRWEILAGQAWSWLTPNRVGLSSYTPEVFYSQNMDFNYQVGLTWTRAPQVRFVFHPNEHWGMGVALENAQQFIGQGAEVAFPAAFNAQLAVQFDAANNSSTPNLHPDVIAKIAYDNMTAGGKHMHLEAAGLLSTIKVTNIPTVTGATFVSHTATGGGVEAAVNLEFLKNIRFVANGFYSDGGGRYIFGMGPDAVIRPVDAPGNTCTIVGTGSAAQALGCDVAISPVHSGSGIVGIEAQITPKIMLYGYYGGAYFQRNFFPDITVATRPNIGFGGPGQVNSSNQNRAIQEPTLGWTQTFWKNPQYGALQLITQASYLTRSPWFVPAGAPKNAHLTMAWVDVRYVLP